MIGADEPVPEKSGPFVWHSGGDELPPSAAPRFIQDLAWSPNGFFIAFSEYTGDSGHDGDETRWAISMTLATPINYRGQQPPTMVLCNDARWVSWSPESDYLAFASARESEPGARNEDIYTIRFNGSDLRRLTSHSARNTQPAWSPDGELIAFSSNRADDKNEDIYVMKADGGGVRRLTTNPDRDLCPQWSPDGSLIVFCREPEGGIYVVGADGSCETRFVPSNYWCSSFPCFAPYPGKFGSSDGPRPPGIIAYTLALHDDDRRITIEWSPNPPSRSWIGSHPLPALKNAIMARWSPDGRRIAFIAGAWPQSAIYIADDLDPLDKRPPTDFVIPCHVYKLVN